MGENSKIFNWFPGHMAKTLGEIEKNLKNVNAIIYVLDARAPLSCFNPKIDKIVAGRPVVYVLNKCDLACDAETKKFKALLESEGKTVVSMCANNNASKTAITKALKTLYESKNESLKRKGISGVMRAMVIGVPNTGKSTLINLLSGAKKATTGDKAGVTKQVSWVKAGEDILLLDTPGTLWPSFDNFEIGLKLAMIGSVKDDVLDMSEMGLEIVKFLSKITPEQLISRYNLKITADEIKTKEPIEVLDEICLNRGFILRKGEIDYERAGKSILDDFRNARIGNITLDKVK